MAATTVGDEELQERPQIDKGIDWADLLGWCMKYVLVPLIPFLIGASIRLLEKGSWSWSALDPVQLSFSFAMLCLLANVSAQRLEESQYRETLAGLFMIGAVLFVSMFAYATSQSEQLSNLQQSGISSVLQETSEGGLLTQAQVEEIMQQPACETIQRRQRIVLGLVGAVGLTYVAIAISLRHKYRLGEDI